MDTMGIKSTVTIISFVIIITHFLIFCIYMYLLKMNGPCLPTFFHGRFFKIKVFMDFAIITKILASYENFVLQCNPKQDFCNPRKINS